MNKKRNIANSVLLLIVIITNVMGCSSNKVDEITNKEIQNINLNTNPNKELLIKEPTIESSPSVKDFYYHKGSLNHLPDTNLDLRGYDLTSIDLITTNRNLNTAWYDENTIWPNQLPTDFNPEKIMEISKNSGLEITKLHEDGITGKGINIAFIDSPLLIEHIEYSKNRVKMYEEIHARTTVADMHGNIVVSIASGKTTGIAPESDIFFINNSNLDKYSGEINNPEDIPYNYTWTAQAIERIIEVNRSLPENDKIRVLSVSRGWDPSMKGYEEIVDSVNKAKQEGIFVVTANLYEIYDGLSFYGLDVDPMKDREDASSYRVIDWKDWIRLIIHVGDSDKRYESFFEKNSNLEHLLIPINTKTVASPTGKNNYTYFGHGGWSMAPPYIAGIYALACQVKPEITPELFWSKALITGESRKIIKDGKIFKGKVINPLKLIKSLKE